MISEERKIFFNWLDTGIAASSLALIVFIPSLSVTHEWAKWFSIAAFIIVVPFALASLLMLKELEVFKNKGSEIITSYHHSSLLIALICYIFGFALFCFSMKDYLLYVFLSAFFLAILMYFSVQRELNRH